MGVGEDVAYTAGVVEVPARKTGLHVRLLLPLRPFALLVKKFGDPGGR